MSLVVMVVAVVVIVCGRHQGRIKTKLGLMLLPGKGPIFFSAFKTDQEVQDSWLATALSA